MGRGLVFLPCAKRGDAWDERAIAVAVRYLRLEGREAEHDTEALELLNRAVSG